MSIVTSDSNSSTNSSVDWDAYRSKNFPVVKKWAYFDHAAVSPLPKPATAAIQKWMTAATEEGDAVWPEWAARVEETRQTAANLVNALPTEIAFTPSTTAGIGYVAEGLNWEKGDNVVLPGGEFPSNLYPWMNLESSGVELRIVKNGPLGEVDLNQIAEACDERTRLVSMSWVGYGTGYRIDPAAAAKVAHDNGALFFLDAIQGLSVFPLDVQSTDIDFFAADGHKWMMGPEGAGLFYCKHEHLKILKPKGIGWNSVKNPYDFGKVALELKDSAGRYEGGTQNMCGVHALGGSLDLITEAGVTPTTSPIGDRVLFLTDLFCEKMEAIGFETKCLRVGESRSGIIGFTKDNLEPNDARNRLLENGVVSSVRKGLLRFSPHAYNNEEDIDRAISTLRS